MKQKNACGKSRKISDPYEVWISFDGSWEWRVLKKYKAPESEARDPYARWFCGVKSPHTYDQFELGDCYVRDIKAGARRVESGEAESKKEIA